MHIELNTYRRSEEIPALPGNNTFHSTELFRVLEQTPGYKPMLVVANVDGTPVGKLLCATRRNFRIPFLSKKTCVYGTGEYFNLHVISSATDAKFVGAIKESIFNEMLHQVTRKLGRRSFIIEFRNIEEPLFGYRYFRKNNFFPIRWLRVRNSIHHHTIDKWMSTSRKRQISRGLQSGAVLDIARTREDVTAFFSLLKHYYSSKIRHFLPSIEFFIALMEQPPGKELGKIFLVRFKEKIIGGSVCIFSGDTCYLVFSAGMRKSYPLQHPGVLSVWKAMVYAREQKFDHFEFIDAGLPFKRYGYREFILRFGGKQLSTRRWFKVRWRWLNKLLIRFYV